MMLYPAAGLSIAGVLALWQTWRFGRQNRRPAQRAGRLLAWFLLAVSLVPWGLAGGADRGVALGILGLMVAALAIVGTIGWREARNPRRRKNSRERTDNERTESPGRAFVRRAWIFVLAGPFSALAAISLTLSLHGLAVSWDPANRLAALLLFAPVAWAVLTIVATYDGALWKRSAGIGGVLVAGLLGAVLVPGGPI